MMPLNHILRKCTAGYKLTKSQEKINPQMYMDDIKLFVKNEKELETNRNKYLGCTPRKIFGTILEVDPRRTDTNGPKNKKTNDDA